MIKVNKEMKQQPRDKAEDYPPNTIFKLEDGRRAILLKVSSAAPTRCDSHYDTTLMIYNEEKETWDFEGTRGQYVSEVIGTLEVEV